MTTWRTRSRRSRQVPADKLKGYVLDLRLNPGGLLDQAISVSDIPQRGEIVSTRGRNPDETPASTPARRRSDRWQAGRRADQRRFGLGVGNRCRRPAGSASRHRSRHASFGKGSVQTIIPLGENGALRLTTALYYTPSGKSIQGTGITPDIKVEEPLPPNCKGKMVTRGESELGPHQGPERERRRVGLGCLRAAGSQGRPAAELCARPAARQEDGSVLPAQSDKAVSAK
jgi:carboxyl-terminal processing protease